MAARRQHRRHQRERQHEDGMLKLDHFENDPGLMNAMREGMISLCACRLHRLVSCGYFTRCANDIATFFTNSFPCVRHLLGTIAPLIFKNREATP